MIVNFTIKPCNYTITKHQARPRMLSTNNPFLHGIVLRPVFPLKLGNRDKYYIIIQEYRAIISDYYR